MTEIEKLIDLMIEAKRTDPETGNFTDYLADYLLEHGVIVLPCKVGDKLFILYDDDYGEYECSELCIGVLQELRVFAKCGISGYKNIQECPEYYCGQPFCSTSFTRKDFGKTVFLTREEAEKALKERSDNE